MDIRQNFITLATICISLSTICGVILHDTHLDKALMAASDHQMIDGDDKAVKTKISATHHTHSDYSQLTTVLRDGSAHPRVTPRGNDRKHLHQKMATRGNHIFDGLVIR